MKRSAVCLVDTEAQADSIVGKLRSAGFSDSDISVLFSNKQSTENFAHKKETKMPEGTTVGAGTGGLIGGTIGLLAGIGALAIPGLGPFIAAGPIMAALSGGALGAVGGGLAGALVGLGIPEYEAKRYEGAVKEGGILVSVQSDSADKTTRAEEIFRQEGAHDISSSGDAQGTSTSTGAGPGISSTTGAVHDISSTRGTVPDTSTTGASRGASTGAVVHNTS
ncbi:MAG: general stress protein, partial [Verrucomicrobia bacterium]|nr:general stress protein [Verrucomicrobiota bacterium]